ncbi:MAG: hypothetical protein ACOX3H_02565 [Saccharofermentanales bacterium]|jgi:hypothetical protein
MKLFKIILTLSTFLLLIITPLTSVGASTIESDDAVLNDFHAISIHENPLKISDDLDISDITDLSPEMLDFLHPDGVLISVDKQIINVEATDTNGITPFGIIPESQLELRVYVQRLPDSETDKIFHVSIMGIWLEGEEPFWRLTDYMSLAWSDEFYVDGDSVNVGNFYKHYLVGEDGSVSDTYVSLPLPEEYPAIIQEHVPKSAIVAAYDLSSQHTPCFTGLSFLLKKPIEEKGIGTIVAQYFHTKIGIGPTSITIGISGKTPVFSMPIGFERIADNSGAIIKNLDYRNPSN